MIKLSIYFTCLKKRDLQQQVVTNPYFKQRPNINKIFEKTKTTLDNNIKPKLDNNKTKNEFQKPKTGMARFP